MSAEVGTTAPERRYGMGADAAQKDRIMRALRAVPALAGAEIGVQVLGSHITLSGTVATLAQEQLGKALSDQPVAQHACQLINCPRGGQLQQAVTETIAVLEETKGSFKSKALGDLRRKLELVLEHV